MHAWINDQTVNLYTNQEMVQRTKHFDTDNASLSPKGMSSSLPLKDSLVATLHPRSITNVHPKTKLNLQHSSLVEPIIYYYASMIIKNTDLLSDQPIGDLPHSTYKFPHGNSKWTCGKMTHLGTIKLQVLPLIVYIICVSSWLPHGPNHLYLHPGKLHNTARSSFSSPVGTRIRNTDCRNGCKR